MENTQLMDKMSLLKQENTQLTQQLTNQRAQLAKHLNEVLKYKEAMKALKDSIRQKMKEKDDRI